MTLHPAEQYAQDVAAGKITANKWVNLAVRRHLKDLERAAEGKDFNFYFDRPAAEKAIKFFSFLKHSKGKWAGNTFILSPWQQFLIWAIFGWKCKSGEKAGCRRFRKAYVKVAKKNGKSTLCAGVGLYLFVADQEPGAEVYSAATKRDQARIVHGEAIAMVRHSPALKKRITIYKDNLSIPASRSKFIPLGAGEESDDGLSPSGAIIDELHAHKTRICLDMLDQGTGARRQPLIFIITTAGSGRVGVDLDEQKYAQEVLSGVREDESLFALIYAIDESDKWEDENCWIKANPNLGISVSMEDLRAQARKAKGMPTARATFLQKRLNLQTDASVAWIPQEKWDACKDPITDERLAGRRCFFGWDLSSKLDIAGYALIFPPNEEDSKWRLKLRMFVPKETAREREESAEIPYQTWIDEGFLIGTEGNVIDYDFIKHEMKEDAKRFDLVESGYDPWTATQIALQMQDDGMTCVEVSQGFSALSEPSKEFEKLVVAATIGHDGNPVMNWMISNVCCVSDPAGNIKPSKKHSPEKIDGVVMTVIAIARALVDSQMESYGAGHDLLII